MKNLPKKIYRYDFIPKKQLPDILMVVKQLILRFFILMKKIAKIQRQLELFISHGFYGFSQINLPCFAKRSIHVTCLPPGWSVAKIFYDWYNHLNLINSNGFLEESEIKYDFHHFAGKDLWQRSNLEILTNFYNGNVEIIVITFAFRENDTNENFFNYPDIFWKFCFGSNYYRC